MAIRMLAVIHGKIYPELIQLNRKSPEFDALLL